MTFQPIHSGFTKAWNMNAFIKSLVCQTLLYYKNDDIDEGQLITVTDLDTNSCSEQ